MQMNRFLSCLLAATAAHASAQAPKVWTPQELFQRNVGTREQQDKQFPPHKMIGNIYYVGTETLASFLIATPQGHILVNSMYERNVPTIRKSVEDLGFKFTDVKIILGSHAHADHMEADALMKEMSGAQVMAMAEDVPALQAMKPGGKAHPIDRVLHDGDQVTLGGTTLIAHLTGGHTMGCTTWTMKAQDAGQTYDVMFGCSLRPPDRLTPANMDEFTRSFALVRALPCDVQLGDHGAQYDMQAKHAKLRSGGPNPFIDRDTCKIEAEISEAMFRAILAEQQQAGPR